MIYIYRTWIWKYSRAIYKWFFNLYTV